MSISSFFQFMIGFIVGTIFFTLGIGGGLYFFLSKMTVNPSQPVFSEETSDKSSENKPVESSSDQKNNTPSNANENKTKATENRDQDLPAGAYWARVTWSTGLSLRAEPDKNAERIGGVGYNWELIILSYSDDKKWQRVRIPSSGQEGWVKAGNVEKIEE